MARVDGPPPPISLSFVRTNRAGTLITTHPDKRPVHPFEVRALGEIAIRCRDHAGMVAFYRDIVGLKLLASRDNGITFFRIAEGYAQHTAVLALFPGNDAEIVTGPHSSLHHLALTLSFADQDAAMAFFAENHIAWRVEIFDWIGWRGIFITDPDGNTVELVAAIPGHLAHGNRL